MAWSPHTPSSQGNLFCIDVGLALLGDELEPNRNVRLCIEEGRIVSIEKGRGTPLVAIPAFVNAHLHVLDYGFAGLAGVAKDMDSLLRWPDGLKARAIQAAPCRSFWGLSRLAKRLSRMGYGVVAVFVEGPGGACRLVREVFAEHGVLALTYGRAYELDMLVGCDGLGAPVLTTRKWVRVALEARSRGFRVAAHISETPEQALLEDYNTALTVGLEHAVHLLYAPPQAHHALAEAGILPVYSPASNVIHWGVEPQPYAPFFALGGDNAGWVAQNPWELARWAMLALRKKGLSIREASKTALKALTVWPLSRLLGVKGINEGEYAFITLLYAPEIVKAIDAYTALLSIGDIDTVVAVLTHLESKSKAQQE
ncbi:hypothetical protein Pyrfu_0842 [Pyrolobus fumarii 1A]|uniref:Amidohydrolase n=1 Tax=Pyrolobus fumarii (strain DSM 11204 / 1A) TaxID=694429 RepID=G0EDU2_PYRF1|nr:hypothetical protein [Pyrolobus fumarii]AEM38711.1 hypothetical protein Pyrfu_0842 [Pyrolobus fumarii 1A]